MTRAAFVPLGVAALLPVAASAFPDGAPWDALDAPDEACASCHLGEPVVQSDALSVEGMDGQLVSGETYSVTLRFTPENAELLGFLASFGEGERIVAGGGLEACETAVRSISAVPSGHVGAAWMFAWTAPAEPGSVILHLAGVAANDDASPLGDVVHLKTLSFEVGPKPASR